VQGIPRGGHLGDATVERGNLLRGERAGPGPVVGCIESEQLCDLVEGEAGGLGGANEPQSLQMPDVVSPDTTGAG